MQQRRRLLAFLAAAIAASHAPLTSASDTAYPDRPLRIVVPFAPGGSTDLLARSTGEVISAALKQSIIVENKAGASGNIGAEAVARAKPDGYTLLFTTTNLTLNPAVTPNLSYDPLQDFAPITMVAFAPMILVTRPDFGGDSLQSLIQIAKDKPGSLNFSSSGAGGAPHLAGELLKTGAGIDMVHVPYAGATQAITDVVSGEVHMTFTTYISAQPMIAAGKLKAVGVASKKRLPVLPDVPTFAELGMDELEIGTMFGLLAPAGTPEPVVKTLYESLETASRQDGFRDNIVRQGGEVVVNTPREYGIYLKAEVEKWHQLVGRIGKIDRM